MNILNVCAKFPGSTHESHIWRISPLLGLLKHSIGHKSYFLLGSYTNLNQITNFFLIYWL
jgi:hypothetical protein